MNVKKMIFPAVIAAVLAVPAFSFPAGGPKGARPDGFDAKNGRPGRPPKELAQDNAKTIMGSVISADADKQSVVIENADGQKVTIKVNPLTRIVRIDVMNDEPSSEDSPAPGAAASAAAPSADNQKESRPMMRRADGSASDRAAVSDSDRKHPPRARPEFEKLSFEDLKTGAWVMVKTFDTETKTAEARVISVFVKDKTAAK